MRLVFAIVSFAVAAVLIGTGIAQRTIFAEPDRVVLSVSASSESPVTVIDGSALNAFAGSQTVLALRREECVLTGPGEIALGASFEDFSVPTINFQLSGGAVALQHKGR